ncbi:hypothetical protein [Ponticoccus sp. (in: a-proteobacteria)]|uniref:hypothetical protein n=1 Tax=Ponticoccus sp. (in: a-proteobacteria) TaxID=1925025 RepID=UPI003AB2CC7C
MLKIMIEDLRRNVPFLIAIVAWPTAIIGTAAVFHHAGIDADVGLLVGLSISAASTSLWQWIASARRRHTEQKHRRKT